MSEKVLPLPMLLPLESGSVCAGIGGFDLGFENAGINTAWQIEFDDDANSVLEKRFPNAYRGVRDLTDPKRRELKRVPIITGGTPCQGFSLAGLRGSMEDDRSNLCLQFVKLLDEHEPAIFVWENVPGVLSADDNAFGIFLAGLVGASSALIPPRSIKRWRVVDRYPDCTDDCERDDEGKRKCGHASIKVDVFSWPNAGVVVGPKRTVAWRVLDSQFFGVAQRRERVFVVGDALGGCSPEILFERRRMSWNSEQSRETRSDIANALKGSLASGGPDDNKAQGNHIVAVEQRGYRMTAFGEYADDNKASTIKQRDHKDATDLVVTQTTGFNLKDGQSEEGKTPPLRSRNSVNCNQTGHGDACVAFHPRQDPISGDKCPALEAKGPMAIAFQRSSIARGKGSTPSDKVAPTLSAESDGDQQTCVAISQPLVFDTAQVTQPTNRSNPKPGDPSPTLHTGSAPAVAFGIKGSDKAFARSANGSRSGDKGDGGINTSLAVNQFGVRR